MHRGLPRINNTLVFVRRRSLDNHHFVFVLVQIIHLQVDTPASPCEVAHPLHHLGVDLGRLPHHVIN
jgi:hypothetical protein